MEQFQTIAPLMGNFYIPPLVQPYIPAPQQIINDNDVINVGSGSITNRNPSPVTVTEVTTPTYTALSTDYMLCVLTNGPVTIILPAGILGTVYIIKDCFGDAHNNPITIEGSNSELVDGNVATINTPYGALQLIFNGTDWSIV
jgi:hypothetical protein